MHPNILEANDKVDFEARIFRKVSEFAATIIIVHPLVASNMMPEAIALPPLKDTAHDCAWPVTAWVRRNRMRTLGFRGRRQPIG